MLTRESVPEWVYGREILVHKVPEVREDVARYVCEGAEAAVKKIGVDFKVRYVGEEFSPKISEALNIATVRAYLPPRDPNTSVEHYNHFRKHAAEKMLLNYQSLSKSFLQLMKSSELKKETANVIVVSQRLIDHDGIMWHLPFGVGSMEEGFGAIYLNVIDARSERVPHYARSLAFHEAMHMIGRISHHPEEEYESIIDELLKKECDLGFPPSLPENEHKFTEKNRFMMENKCTMLIFGDPSMALCSDHLAQARDFWKEVEEATGEKFLTEEAPA